MKGARSRARSVCILVHRWTGLAIALFLIVTGLTGTAIAFYDELEHALNPHLYRVQPQSEKLPALRLRQIALALEPRADVHLLRLHQAPDEALMVKLQPRTNPDTGQPHELAFDEVFLDPYSGTIKGTRRFDDPGLDREHLMPTIFMLHATFLLGSWGVWLLGSAALVWVINCFIGFYLTLPERRGRFLHGWKRSWLVRSAQSVVRLSFELHRAAGLWVWAMLLVLAISSVQFNLEAEVFRPALTMLVDLVDPQRSLERHAGRETKLDWEDALARGRELMSAKARSEPFDIYNEAYLDFDPERGVYSYSVNSSLDVRNFGGQTQVYFSAVDGRELAFVHPYVAAGNALEAWLAALHRGIVWGRPFQIFVALIGIVVAIISITGVLVWFKRRTHMQRGPT